MMNKKWRCYGANCFMRGHTSKKRLCVLLSHRCIIRKQVVENNFGISHLGTFNAIYTVIVVI